MGTKSKTRDHFDVVIVGAGFAGMYMLHRTRGMGFSARIFEAGGGVGGTWYWNRYPGARCDVESVQYSYQFSEALQQEWDWTERYATAPEILRYANHVADRFDLRRDMQLNTRVEAAAFDEEAGHWVIDTSDGAFLRTGPREAGGTPVRAAPLPPATRVFATGEHPSAPEWMYVTAFLPHEIVRGYVQGLRVNLDLP